MNRVRQFVTLVLCLLLFTAAQGERRRDSLTDTEVDRLRDAALDADQRLKLYVEFARARLVSLEQMRADPKVTDRAQQTHDRLQEFIDIYDELNDNIETYDGRKADLRKVLKVVIEGDTEFQAKLRALKESVAAAKEVSTEYDFQLSMAIETVDDGVQDHRQLLGQQEEAAKHRKPSGKQSPEQPK